MFKPYKAIYCRKTKQPMLLSADTPILHVNEHHDENGTYVVIKMEGDEIEALTLRHVTADQAVKLYGALLFGRDEYVYEDEQAIDFLGG